MGLERGYRIGLPDQARVMNVGRTVKVRSNLALRLMMQIGEWLLCGTKPPFATGGSMSSLAQPIGPQLSGAFPAIVSFDELTKQDVCFQEFERHFLIQRSKQSSPSTK